LLTQTNAVFDENTNLIYQHGGFQLYNERSYWFRKAIYYL